MSGARGGGRLTGKARPEVALGKKAPENLLLLLMEALMTPAFVCVILRLSLTRERDFFSFYSLPFVLSVYASPRPLRFLRTLSLLSSLTTPILIRPHTPAPFQFSHIPKFVLGLPPFPREEASAKSLW